MHARCPFRLFVCLFTWVWKQQAGAVLRTWCCRCSDRSSHFARWMYSRFAWALARMRRASPNLFAASRSPALLCCSPQYGPQLSPLESCSVRSPGALLKINAGPDFPLQTSTWIGLELCINPIRFSRWDYGSLRGNWGLRAGYGFIQKQKGEKRRVYLRIPCKGHNSGFSSQLLQSLSRCMPPPRLTTSPTDFTVLFVLPYLFCLFIRDRVGVALDLPKINICLLLCYSD